jgi:hypothetical protein
MPPPGQCPVLVFELAGGEQVILNNCSCLMCKPDLMFVHCPIQALVAVRSVIEMRMIEHETVRLEGNKYSGQHAHQATNSLLSNSMHVVLQ